MRIKWALIRLPCLNHFTVPLFHRPSVSLCRHVTIRPCYRATIPPSHGATWCATVPPGAPPCHLLPTRPNRVSVTPGEPPWHYCAAVPPRAPPWHNRSTMPSGAPSWHLVRHHVTVPTCRRRATVPPYQHATCNISIYLCTPAHMAYFITHLTPVNHTFVPPDIAGRNFTIRTISKIAMTTLIGFPERPWVLQ